MTEGVLVAIVGAIGLVMTAFLGYLGVLATRSRSESRVVARVAKEAADNSHAAAISSKLAADDSASVKVQVNNDHDTNFREEQDERHDAVMAALATMARVQGEHGAAIATINTNVATLAAADLEAVKQANIERERLTAHLAESKGSVE